MPRPAARPRFRARGATPGTLLPRPLNAITDVAGLHVGHTSVFKIDDARTVLTTVLPHAGYPNRERVPARLYVGNGFGESSSHQVREMVELEAPILLTNAMVS